MQKRDQVRARKVFDHIKPLENDPMGKLYGSLALAAPILIRTAGLLPAIAFYKAKNKPHHQKLLANLEAELKSLNILADDSTLHAHLLDCDLNRYIRLTREVLILCRWHKRYAQSVLKVEPGEDGNE